MKFIKNTCFIFEIGSPALRPFWFKSRWITRFGFLWFSFAIIPMSLHDYSVAEDTRWIGEGEGRLRLREE